MRRGRLRWAIAAVAATGVAAAPAIAAPATTTEPPRAALEGMVCQRASNSLDRAVQVTAVMRPVTGTEQIEMMFELQQRPPDGSTFTDVRAGDLGKWRHPADPTLGQRSRDVWKLSKPVVNLAAPAVYRFVVTFQWIGHSGRQLERIRLRSQLCYQP
jgi:hypothetical protein